MVSDNLLDPQLAQRIVKEDPGDAGGLREVQREPAARPEPSVGTIGRRDGTALDSRAIGTDRPTEDGMVRKHQLRPGDQ
jgi:hypothetical protein